MPDAPDFRTILIAAVYHLGHEIAAPAGGEAVLIAQTVRGTWVRTRLRPYRYLPFMRALLLKGLILQMDIERLALVVPEDFENGPPRTVQVACLDRATNQDETLEAPIVALDGRSRPGPWTLLRGDPSQDLARLVRLARKALSQRETSGRLGSWRLMLGRPWPLTMLVLVLVLELFTGMLRLRWLLAGYGWMPLVPHPADVALFGLYLLMIAATAGSLWLGISWAYRLALALAAVQFIRPMAVALILMPTIGAGRLAYGLLIGWLSPTLICLVVWQVTHARIHRPVLIQTKTT